METLEAKTIESCRSGNLRDFSWLYDAYVRKIYNFIYFKTRHRQLAEDLTSQTFFKALKNIGKFDPAKGQFSSWLYRIARNLVIDHWRTQKTENDVSELWNLGSIEDLSADARSKERLRHIKESLAKLDSQQREIIIMRVWDGLTHREISEILGKRESNCKMIYSRAIAKLRKEEILATVMFLLIFGCN